MKVNELSVGDWVQVRSVALRGEERLSPPMRVSAIGEDWVNTMIDHEQGDPFEDDIKDIRPIPLTAGILEKNGFERISESPYVLEYRLCVDGKCESYLFVNFRLRTGMIQVCFDSAGTFPKIGFTKYEMFVHDLQHALFMCGIDKDIIL